MFELQPTNAGAINLQIIFENKISCSWASKLVAHNILRIHHAINDGLVIDKNLFAFYISEHFPEQIYCSLGGDRSIYRNILLDDRNWIGAFV